MPIISVRDNENNGWKRKEKKTERNKGVTQAIVTVWELHDFFVGLSRLLLVICKTSLISKSNLELASSITLKERELYESKDIVVECRCQFS